MAIPLLKVALSSGVTLATVGGGVLVLKNMGGSSVTPMSTVKDRLKRDGYSPLDIGKSNGWSEILTAYAKSNISFRFDHGDRQISEQEVKNACESIFKEDENNSGYEKAKKWCVVPKSVSQVLTSKSLKVLDVTKTNDEDKEKWDPLKDAYKANDIPNFSFSGADEWKQLRTKCKELVEKKPWDDGYASSITYAERWCIDKVTVD